MITFLSLLSWPVLYLIIRNNMSWTPYVSWIASGSIATFAAYGLDKAAAKLLPSSRIRELILHFMSLLGGFGGAAVGMVVFRHKFRHADFVAIIILSALLHYGLISGLAAVNGL